MEGRKEERKGNEKGEVMVREEKGVRLLVVEMYGPGVMGRHLYNCLRRDP